MIEYTVKVYGKNEDNLAGTHWYLNGKRHRVDGPAIEYANGDKCWYLNHNLHRVDGPAIEYADGGKHWYLNGKCHRVDGPAIEYANGDKCWYLNGKYHRVDGPAIEYANGGKHWYLNGINYSEADFKLEVAKLNKQTLPCDGIVIDGKKYKLIAV